MTLHTYNLGLGVFTYQSYESASEAIYLVDATLKTFFRCLFVVEILR